ncbi:quinone oxidoreductase [Pseudomaricurvus alkylphenolicus]|uniref:quinone oxidoreductase family protein n=1 Tax=Pseudomaricurvus alkylphenolicus TaxID=1306991 RepID=UPI0014214827|nr:quinone oxidoreductase [Pseudomaricurvus alkylphenolicus]NIB40832.1 quinone oxidoreductase [Pseudomaricurvus alkylphenolicus]
MVKAMVVRETGGPEVFSWEDIEIADPGAGEALIKHSAIGLNYIDVYHRNGEFPVPSYPAVVGIEGAGVVEAVGPGVNDVAVGDRVAYTAGIGSYAEKRLIAADRLVKIPEGISDVDAAGIISKGMTAESMIRRCYRVKEGDTVLIHAAAGGMGLIMSQWCKHLGARVIGTVSTEKKAEMAREAGCDDVILYSKEDFVARVKELTNGELCDVVYDSVGATTFLPSIQCVKRRGTLVNFGTSSGLVPDLDMSLPYRAGSIYVTRASVIDYTVTREEVVESANAVWDVIKAGGLTVNVNQTYSLKDAAKAHADLEARKTTGSTVLIP